MTVTAHENDLSVNVDRLFLRNIKVIAILLYRNGGGGCNSMISLGFLSLIYYKIVVIIIQNYVQGDFKNRWTRHLHDCCLTNHNTILLHHYLYHNNN